MMCYGFDRRITGYLDGVLDSDERRDLLDHLAQCGECRNYAQQLGRIRSQIRRVPVREVPENLAVKLRVMASQEASRRRSGDTGSLMMTLAKRLNLWVENLMRPFALPLAGGLVSAVVLFSMLVPTMTVLRGDGLDDVPTILTTGASIKDSLPLGDTGDGVVVDLVVDENGRMVSYSFVSGPPMLAYNPEIRRAIESKLLVTRFEPATFFGQPTSSRLRISFRRSTIEVKG
jgi:hypothetical protein